MISCPWEHEKLFWYHNNVRNVLRNIELPLRYNITTWKHVLVLMWWKNAKEYVKKVLRSRFSALSGEFYCNSSLRKIKILLGWEYTENQRPFPLQKSKIFLKWMSFWRMIVMFFESVENFDIWFWKNISLTFYHLECTVNSFLNFFPYLQWLFVPYWFPTFALYDIAWRVRDFWNKNYCIRVWWKKTFLNSKMTFFSEIWPKLIIFQRKWSIFKWELFLPRNKIALGTMKF